MSLQRTSKVDRSDPTVASAHSRSPSQDCSSRSSSRMKRGSEAPWVWNQSNWRRPSELRRAGTRLPLDGTGHGPALPSSEAPSSDASAISASAATGGSTAITAMASAAAGASDAQHVWWARGHGRASSLPQRDGRLDRGVSLGSSPHGNWCRLSPRCGASCEEVSWPARPSAALAAEADVVLRTFRGARSVEPCLRLLRRKGKSGSGHMKEEPGQRYPKILTHSGP
jgi:hypothetical protein